MRVFARGLPLLLFACAALGASRARYGGTLQVAVTGPRVEAEPSLADVPEAAAVLSLSTPGLCRLDAKGNLQPVLAQELSRPLPQRVRVTFRSPGASSPVSSQDVASAWERLFSPSSPSPYRALLAPLRGGARQLPSAAAAPEAMEFALAWPWPDFERSLCHPALAIPGARGTAPGPYLPAGPGGQLVANPAFPAGRPFLDRLALSSVGERAAARLLASRGAHVVLGGSDDGTGADAPPELFATYLAFSPQRVGADFRERFESAVDRADLVRFFVRGPAVPMHQLLPPALMPQQPLPRPTAPPLVLPRDLTLVFDAALEDSRAVAERIQVKLHDRGYRVVLKAVPRAELRARWASGDFDLMLHGLLLPPLAGPALAVVMEAAGRRDLESVELPLIGAVADPVAREAKARERAEALRPSLSFIPLFARGLRVQASPTVANLALDAQGLPLLEQAFLTE